MDKKRNIILISILFVLLAALAAWGVWLAIQYGYFQKAISLIDEDMPPVLFIALMVILPVLGFPISVFLVVGGIKFGVLIGISLWLLVLPVHALIGYYVANFLRKPLERLLHNKLGYRIPNIPENSAGVFSFLFFAIPGVPYAGKNYLLPLAGAPFRYCVLMNCVVQGAVGAPFVILGKSAAEMDMTLFYVAAVLLFLGFIALRWLKKRHGDKIAES